MCAIFGAASMSMFEVLYEANKHRGVFASSICLINTLDPTKEAIVKKSAKELKFDNKLKPDIFDDGYNYFVGHVQAPTSKKQTWEENTSHPFETEDWLLAHNGVLTNFDKLNKKYCEWNDNPVDTSVIINMIQNESYKPKRVKEIDIISKVCSHLEGTFACYIINKNSGSIYLVRQGSTLFYRGSYFSSVAGKYMSEVPEGTILQLGDDFTFLPVDEFKCSSPFLTL